MVVDFLLVDFIHQFCCFSFICLFVDLTCRHGTTKEHYARVAEKNHRHSINNPYAQFQVEYSLDEILASKEICDPITVSE